MVQKSTVILRIVSFKALRSDRLNVPKSEMVTFLLSMSASGMMAVNRLIVLAAVDLEYQLWLRVVPLNFVETRFMFDDHENSKVVI